MASFFSYIIGAGPGDCCQTLLLFLWTVKQIGSSNIHEPITFSLYSYGEHEVFSSERNFGSCSIRTALETFNPIWVFHKSFGKTRGKPLPVSLTQMPEP